MMREFFSTSSPRDVKRRTMLRRAALVMVLVLGGLGAKFTAAGTLHSTDTWIWAGVSPHTPSASGTLYIFQGHIRYRGGGYEYSREGPLPQSIPESKSKVVLTYRLDRLVSQEALIRLFRQHRRAWEKHDVFVSGLQVDYDCPTSRLTTYAGWLDGLLALLSKADALSITGLGDWLTSAPAQNLRRLAGATDFIAFMMYQNRSGLMPLAPYVQRLEKLEIPFRLGLLKHQVTQEDFELVRRAPGYLGDIVFLLGETP